jgi:hypothetical protein
MATPSLKLIKLCAQLASLNKKTNALLLNPYISFILPTFKAQPITYPKFSPRRLSKPSSSPSKPSNSHRDPLRINQIQ